MKEVEKRLVESEFLCEKIIQNSLSTYEDFEKNFTCFMNDEEMGENA